MATKQQEETLEYFRKHAAQWQAKAAGADGARVNVIEQRNAFVLQVLAERPPTRVSLDVGCGTGELVCAVAKRGVDATGVDYAREMIDLAVRKAGEEGLARARFVCRSIFEFEMGSGTYDLISANGLIEYLSQEELHRFFDLAARALTVGGSLVLGSRNRLFNAVSMNEYTLQEIRSGEIGLLLGEAARWSAARRIEEVSGSECAPVQSPDTEHASTGIKVSSRFQYTPLQLIKLLQERGLRAREVYPVHIHAAPPSFKNANPGVHVAIANLLQSHARHGTSLLAHASTFMLHATKGA